MRLAVGTGRRGPAYYMIIGALVAVLGADSAYDWSLLHNVTGLGVILAAGWIAAHVLFGAAALHPSMTTVSQAAAPKFARTPLGDRPEARAGSLSECVQDSARRRVRRSPSKTHVCRGKASRSYTPGSSRNDRPAP